MNKTSISWTQSDDGKAGATWNPTFGCECVSPGCANCYAMRMAGRFSGPGKPYEGLVTIAKNKRAIWNGTGHLSESALVKPLSWRAPRRVFVNSMSDLFFERFTNEEIAAVFGVMAACQQHTFQVLTKRAKRMRGWFEWAATFHGDPIATCYFAAKGALTSRDRDAISGRCGMVNKWSAVWPLPNVWIGTSVENQAAADERIPELLRTPAAIRFLSCEPLIGPVRLHEDGLDWLTSDHCRGVDWVIAGCESGPGARPCNASWLRSLRDQCAAAGVAYFLKQAVNASEGGHRLYPSGRAARSAVVEVVALGDGSKQKGGGVIELPYLDGVQHAAFPEVRHV